MVNKQKIPINVLRVLELCIDEPIFPKSFDYYIKLREKTSESRIREALRFLVNEDILKSEHKRGRPKLTHVEGGQSGRYDRRFGSKIYYVNLELDKFKKIFNIFYNEDLEKFLKSNYVAQMITTHAFIKLYRQLEDEFKNQDFKSIASKILLDLPVTITEYEDYPDKIYNYLRHTREYSVRLNELWFHEIQILENLDPVISVPFIRSHLIEGINNLYKKIGGRNIHLKSTDGLRLTELDMYLNPFYSYPIFDPIQTIFSKPFDRLYDDIYILNREDLGLMTERIYLIYKNFGEFLSVYLSALDWRFTINLEDSLREYLFLWNCQSYYFSEFYYQYHSFLNERSNYYITRNSGFIQIIDLIENKKLITPEESFSMNSEITYPPLYAGREWGGSELNPFKVLMPCRSLFDKFGFDTTEISFDSILKELRERMTQ